MTATKTRKRVKRNVTRSRTLVTPKNLGEILVERELVTAEQLESALKLQRGNGKEIGDILVERGIISQDDLLTANSLRLGVPLVDLKQREAQQQAIDLIPGRLAHKYNVLPLEIVDSCLMLAMANPEDGLAYQDVQSVSGMRITPVMASADDIREAISRVYEDDYEYGRDNEQIAADIQQVIGAEAQRSTKGPLVKAVEGPLDRIINLIISEAVQNRASDIHIEPQKTKLRIRYRIDGILHEVRALPLNIHPVMISRLKIVAKMNITEQRQPQDGHFSIKMGRKDIDIRIATYCTVFGEMAALRLLNRAFTFMELDELGLNSWALGRYQQLLKTPFGMILVAGPTGSGKTTTLYASVNRLKRDACNILSIEDPIEYEFDGVNQGQVNPKAGVTFAAGLRAMLRLDPDIIVVGEIRDKETARMAVEAALTGCLVLSSIHASDTARVFSRLMHLGVEPYLISSSVVGVVAQRIVRRVCPHCGVPREPAPNEESAYKAEMNEVLDHFQCGEGCDVCANTGYLGRVGLFEVMLVSDAIQQMLVKGASPQQIEAQAVKEGMMSMRMDGMKKVKEGITTPSEVVRSIFSINKL